MPRDASMTGEDLARAVAQHRWYQSIDLGGGLVTPGETGEATCAKLELMGLPERLDGLAVLDIGCNEGFFAFEAERRGAARVLAIDRDREAEAKFGLVRAALGSAAEFRRADLRDLDPAVEGPFDLVFFLAVFHHLRHPLAAMDHVTALTAGTAVMEFVEAVPRDGTRPSALVRRLSKKGRRHLLPTRKFLLEMLESAGYEQVEILAEHRFHRIKEYRDMPGYDEQRVLVKAHRRRGAETPRQEDD